MNHAPGHALDRAPRRNLERRAEPVRSSGRALARRVWLTAGLLLLAWCSNTLLKAEAQDSTTSVSSAEVEELDEAARSSTAPSSADLSSTDLSSADLSSTDLPPRARLRLTSDRDLFAAWVEVTPLQVGFSEVLGDHAVLPAALHWLGDLTLGAQRVDAPEVDASEVGAPPASDAAGDGADTAESSGNDPAAGSKRADGVGSAADLPRLLDPKVVQGPAMVCFGSRHVAVHCAKHFIYNPDRPGVGRLSRALWTPPAADSLALDKALEIEMSAAAGRSIVGRLVQDGLGVEQAKVWLAATGLDAPRGFTLPLTVRRVGEVKASRYVLTDADGGFRLPPVAEGRYELEFALPSSLMHRTPAFEVPPPGAPLGEDAAEVELLNLGEIVVPGGLDLEVLTVDSTGRSVVGAAVEVSQASDEEGEPEGLGRQLIGRSDDQGRVLMSGLRARPNVQLRCSAPGHESAELTFELLPVSAECVMPAMARIIGTVDLVAADPADPETGADTGPLNSVWITAARPGDEAGGERPVVGVPDDQGRFELPNLAAGPWRLTVAAPGYEPRVLPLEPTAGETVDAGVINLSPTFMLEGRVVTTESSEPVPGATVEVIDPWGGGSALTDSGGRFQIPSAGSFPLTLRVFSEDRPPKRVTWTPAQQRATAERVIELQRGGWIRALVGGATPCAGCRLRLVPERAGGEVGGALADMETDAAGEALSEALAPGGYYVLRPRYTSRGTWVRKVPDAEQRFVRVRSGEVSTVRFEAGEALRVRVAPLDRLAGGSLQLRSSLGRQRGIAEGAGIFRFHPDPDERQEVFLTRRPPGETVDELIYLGPLPTAVRRIAVPVGAGSLGNQTRLRDVVELRLNASGLRGRLETWEQQAIADARIRLRGVEDQRFLVESRSAADGTFYLADVYPGVYALFIGERAYQFVSVQAGQVVDLGVFQPTPGSF